MRNYGRFAVIVGLLLLCVAGYFGWHFLSVKYHQYRMEGAYRAAQKLGPHDPNHRSLMNSYQQHRATLMKLGYYTKRQFYLSHLTASSEKFRELLRQLPEQFPYAIGKIEPHGYIYGEPAFIVVWVHPADLKWIEGFVAEQDSSK